MARSAKKKWDESKVTRDESGRFVSQTNVPMMGGQGSSPAYQGQVEMLQRNLNRIQQMTSPAGQQQIRQNHLDMRQRQLNTLQQMTSSAKPRRSRRSSGIA